MSKEIVVKVKVRREAFYRNALIREDLTTQSGEVFRFCLRILGVKTADELKVLAVREGVRV